MTLNEIDEFCLGLPGTSARYPFDANATVRAWCIGKKMFAWTSTNQRPIVVQLKADPDLVPDLVANYESITPGYHMNKRHWISVNAKQCDSGMLSGLLQDSHQLVAASLPRAKRLRLLGG